MLKRKRYIVQISDVKDVLRIDNHSIRFPNGFGNDNNPTLYLDSNAPKKGIYCK